MPARWANSAADRCCELPGPAVPQFSLPGFALAGAISSATLPAYTEGCTTSRFGVKATSEIGTKSRRTSKGRLR